ncbi:MAG: tetratricopeptide repeat protein [Blastocatellia bacterium]|nr:tetratricopeptide repeat protein [Blastocatellia bacterium]
MKFRPPEIRILYRLLAIAVLALSLSNNLFAQEESAASLLTITAKQGTLIWVDSLEYGAVSDSGELTVRNLRAGVHLVRARLKGMREITQTIKLAADSQESIEVKFSAAADEAEESFQIAEELRERGEHEEAIKAYRKAIKLRPPTRHGYPAARLGLARSLTAKADYDRALAEARLARREKSGPYPEVYIVMGNINRNAGYSENALDDYRKALAQAGGLSPEAHTGIAIIYEDLQKPEEAIEHFRLAVAQANDTEPIIYFLLGTALEREYRNKEAVEAYEKYMELAPGSTQAISLKSVVRQLKHEVR